MTPKKQLKSEPKDKAEIESKKKLTSAISSPSNHHSGKKITSEKQTPNTYKKIPDQETKLETTPDQIREISGDTMQERITNSTIAGGLNEVPRNFDDQDGDWSTIKSENPFERLYLDYKEFRSITPQIIETNYKLIDKFWTQKIHIMQTGASKVKIIRKYAGVDGSERTILNYKQLLKQAYERLTSSDGIETTYYQIEEKRKGSAREKIEPHILSAIEDKVLEPSEERMIKVIARQETELTEDEIDSLINEYLEKTNSIRGKGGGDIPESQRLFLYTIKKHLDDKLLTESDEKDLLNDTKEFNIPPDRYEDLVIKALREVDESERQKTLENDKKDFNEFYFGLLRDFGLTEDEKLPEEARNQLSLRDNSETDFFPLSQNTRNELVENTTKLYQKNLMQEKKDFYKEALRKLDLYDGHVEEKDDMLKSKKYVLLLSQVREQLIAEAIEEIIEKQSDAYIKAAKKYFQMNHWFIPEDKQKQFLTAPATIKTFKKVRSDWLDKEKRLSLYEDTRNWSEEQYENEIQIINARVSKELKKNIYGLPIKLQTEIEKDKSLYLHKDKRRKLIISLESENRNQAVQKFNDMVQNALVFDTLIPDVEKNLLEQGEKELLLTVDKNKISIKVDTAVEIIQSLRTLFEDVLADQITKMVNARKMDDELVEEYNLDHSAYITRTEVDKFIKDYKPKNKTEQKTVFSSFSKIANNANLYIVSENAKQEFDEVLLRAMEQSSTKYRYSLKRWFNDRFKENLVKVGAAYGVTEQEVKSEFEFIKTNYPKWTRPKWTRFVKWFIAIAGLITGIRALITLSGYNDWIFLWGATKKFQMHEMLKYIDFDEINYDVLNNELWIYTYIGFIVLYILLKMFKATKRKSRE